MVTFGSGKSSPFERVDFSLYRFLSSLSKSDSTQTFVVTEATFDLTRLMFALFFCLPDLCACALVYKIKTNASRLLDLMHKSPANNDQFTRQMN